MAPVDPVTFEVIRNALVAATDEMALALKRSAYSTNIKTRSDFSCAFFDAELRAVAQGFAQPVHLGSMVEQVPKAVLEYGPEKLAPGDMLVTNDPYPSGVHLNDVSLISPVHCEGELLGYVANLAHHVDVGGGAPASIGAFREVFQEGVIIPPVKLVAAGRIVDDVFRLILAQIRSNRETAGDFRAQIAANATGTRRLQSLVEPPRARDGARRDGRAARLHRARTRAELAALPHGVYEAEGSVDNDGFTDEPVRLRARVEIGADGVRFDTDGLRPAAAGTRELDLRADVLGLRLRAQVPHRSRLARQRRLLPPLDVHAPPGTVDELHAAGARRRRLGDADASRRLIFRALLPAFPKRLPAGTKAMMCQAGFGGARPRGAATYDCFYETFAGGYGGRFGSDGPDAVQTHGQNTENAPVEETELNYPVRICGYELIPDSRRAGPHARRARPADATTSSTARRRSRSWPTATAGGRGASFGGQAAARRRDYVLEPATVRAAAARLEVHARARARRRRLLSAPAAAAATARPRSASRSASCATCARAR